VALRGDRALLPALVGAGLLRGYGLGREGLWLDELSSVTVAREPWALLPRVLRDHDNHPPLYFALLKLWGAVAGYGDAAVRVPSLAAGVALVWLVGALAGRLAGPEARRYGWCLAGSASFLVYHAREARNYSLLAALALGSAVLSLDAAPTFRAGPSARWTAVALAALHTHVYAPFSLAAQALAAWVAWRRAGRPLGAGRRALFAGGAVAALFLPWAWVVLGQGRRVHQGFWLPSPGVRWLWEWGGSGLAGGLFALGVVLGWAWGVRASWARHRAGAALLTGMVLLPLAVPGLWSYAVRPVLYGRYTIAAMASAVCGCAVGLAALPPRAGRALAVGLTLLGALTSVRDVHRTARSEPWRELARFCAQEARAGAVPAVLPRYPKMLRHYLPGGVTLWGFERGEAPERVAAAVDRDLAARGGDRFWLLAVHPETDDPALVRALHPRFAPTRVRVFHRGRATLWVRRGAPAAGP
jgi:mannosyltransferase